MHIHYHTPDGTPDDIDVRTEEELRVWLDLMELRKQAHAAQQAARAAAEAPIANVA